MLSRVWHVTASDPISSCDRAYLVHVASSRPGISIDASGGTRGDMGGGGSSSIAGAGARGDICGSGSDAATRADRFVRPVMIIVPPSAVNAVRHTAVLNGAWATGALPGLYALCWAHIPCTTATATTTSTAASTRTLTAMPVEQRFADTGLRTRLRALTFVRPPVVALSVTPGQQLRLESRVRLDGLPPLSIHTPDMIRLVRIVTTAKPLSPAAASSTSASREHSYLCPAYWNQAGAVAANATGSSFRCVYVMYMTCMPCMYICSLFATRCRIVLTLTSHDMRAVPPPPTEVLRVWHIYFHNPTHTRAVEAATTPSAVVGSSSHRTGWTGA